MCSVRLELWMNCNIFCINEPPNKWRPIEKSHEVSQTHVFDSICIFPPTVFASVKGLSTHAMQSNCILLSKGRYVSAGETAGCETVPGCSRRESIEDSSANGRCLWREMCRHQYWWTVGTSMIADFGDVEGVVHSEVMPLGTDLNSERRSVTPGRLKAWLRRLHPQMKQPVLQHDTVWPHSIPRDAEGLQRLGFNADLAPSDFRSFPRFKNVSEDVTTFRKVKSGQRLGCDSVTKLHSCVTTHWWRYLRDGEKPLESKGDCAEK
jgi:hypothetical protein